MWMYKQGAFLDIDLDSYIEQYKDRNDKLILDQDIRTKKYNN